MAWRSAAAPRVIRLALGENDLADAAGSAGVPGIRIDFRSGFKLQDYSVLRLSCVRILAGCVCDATLDAHATPPSAGRPRSSVGSIDDIIRNTLYQTVYQLPQRGV